MSVSPAAPIWPARGAPVRLAHRSAGTQAPLLHHAWRLSRRDRSDRIRLGFSELRPISLLTGAGISGENTAIASSIQEFVPARYRGWTDLVINGSFWVGAAFGAAASIVLLNPALLPPDLGRRAAFFIGALFGLVILVMRSWVPESPRWLMIHGKTDEAHAILDAIEDGHWRRGHHLPAEDLVFVGDVNANYRPWLVPTGRLYDAQNTIDSSSRAKRGLLDIDAP